MSFCNIFILLVLLQVVLANVPTGCVVLINGQANKYMARSVFFDKQNRLVVPADDPSQVWYIIQRDREYRIKVRGRVNELYAASNHLYNKERRSVFVWEPINQEAAEGAWDIQQLSNGKYSIRNIVLDEYLYSSISIGRMLTWTPKDVKPIDNVQFQWDILEC